MSIKTFELQAQLRAAEILIPAGSTWQHKKGGIYEVVDHHVDSDDGIRVCYRRIGGPEYNESLESGIVFSRKLDEWNPDRFLPCEIKIVAV